MAKLQGEQPKVMPALGVGRINRHDPSIKSLGLNKLTRAAPRFSRCEQGGSLVERRRSNDFAAQSRFGAPLFSVHWLSIVAEEA